MDWPRVKSLLILLFLLINLALIASIWHTQYQKNTVSPQVIAQAVQVLKKNGVQIDETLISKQRDHVSAKTLPLTAEEKKEAAAVLLGKSPQVEYGQSDGVTTYFNADGEKLIIGDDGRLNWNGSAETDGREGEAAALYFADALAGEGLKSYVKEGGDTGSFVLGQQLDGLPIDGSELKVNVDGETVTAADGTWLLSTPTGQGQSRLTDSLNAVLLYPAMAGDAEGAAITGVELVYCLHVSPTGNTLVPAYRITDDREEQYLVSTLTGKEMKT